MIITVKCPSCQSKVKAVENEFGREKDCPNCSSTVEVPKAHVGEGVTLGKYDIIARIGKGGMGEVFLAEQQVMQRRVALKVLPSSMTTDEEAVKRFLKEARMSARFDHPNIVTVLDAGHDNGFFFIAMTYVQGETLDQKITRDGPMAEEEALRHIMSLVIALDYAWNRHHVLHRDIKPSNVMIDSDGKLRLLDMGLAKDILEGKSLTAAGTILGTPFYMSPEQAKADSEFDFRSDMYSVGATLFHLVAGKPPFDGDTPVNIMTKHILEDPPKLREVNPELSAGISALVDIMLRKEPDKRYPSYEVLLEHIDAVLDGKVPTSPRPRSYRWPKRSEGGVRRKSTPRQRLRRRLWAVATGLFIVLGILALLPEAKPTGPQPGTPVANNPDPDPEPDPEPEGPSREELERRALIAGQMKDVDEFLERNPKEIETGIRRYQALQLQAEGTSQEKQVKERLKSLQRDLRKVVNQAWASIARAAERDVEAGLREKAIRDLKTYDGEWAEQTEKRRLQLVAEIEAGIAEEKRQAEARKRRLEEKRKALASRREREFQNLMNKYLDGIAGHIMGQDFNEALAEYERALNDRHLKNRQAEVEKHLDGVKSVCLMNFIILQSFEGDKGNEIVVQLKDESAKLQINEIIGTAVHATKFIRKGSATGREKYRFSPSELALAERARRLAPFDTPIKKMMKAVLLYEAGKKDSVIEELTGMDTPLSEALIDTLSQDPEWAWTRLLRAAELPANEDDIDRLRRHFENRKYTEEQREQIVAEAERFIRRFGSNRQQRSRVALAHTMVQSGQIDLPKGLRRVFPETVDGSKFSDNAREGITLQRQFAQEHKLAIEVQNSIGIRFRLIPTGAYWSGLGKRPEDPYYIGKLEITQRQWRKLLPKHTFKNYDPGNPAHTLNLDMIKQFLDKLCEHEGLPKGTYRLPTSNEWLYACRANTRTRWYFGNNEDELHKHGNYLDKEAPDNLGPLRIGLMKDKNHSDGFARLAPAGKFPANPWGLHDMHGNVAEYIVDGSFNLAREKDRAVLRGGAWWSPKIACVADASFRPSDFKITHDAIPQARQPLPFGFRIVREISLD